MNKSISKTNEFRARISTKFFTEENWIAQDEDGTIYLYKNKPILVEEFGIWLYLLNLNLILIACLGKTTKTRCNKTYTQACAQLTVDNWWLDRYGRLIVEDRNTPNLLKEQA